MNRMERETLLFLEGISGFEHQIHSAFESEDRAVQAFGEKACRGEAARAFLTRGERLMRAPATAAKINRTQKPAACGDVAGYFNTAALPGAGR